MYIKVSHFKEAEALELEVFKTRSTFWVNIVQTLYMPPLV
jgi:hypothetical protein